MSLLYSGLYFITNILGPISFMVYTQLKSFTFSNKNLENLSKDVKLITHQQHNLKGTYGKWFMLILSIFVFNFISILLPKSLIVIFLGLIVKAAIIKGPQSLVHIFQLQNYSLEQIIQKLHLQVHLQIFKSKTIETYLDLSEKLNFYIIFYNIDEKEERLQVLSQIKDSASRIQIQLEDNQEIKNKSFIVAVKKMQTMKNIKSYQNIGVNCDILKGSEVGKELLKILEEKTLAKERSQGPSRSKIQQPTKDKLDQSKRGAKSTIQPPRSQSLQQKIQKVKHSVNVPTSEKKILRRQQKQDESQYAIQRSLTFDIDQLEFQQSPSKNREHNHLSYYPKTQKDAAKPQSSSSIASNPQNVGLLDIATSERSQIKKGSASPNPGSLEGILQSLDQTNQGQPIRLSNQEQPTSPDILPYGANISSIGHKAVHPFKVNLSSLTNPLLISDQQSKSKILPPSLYGSQQALLLSSGNRKLISSSSIEKVKKQHLQNISQVQTQIMMQEFSQSSSIPNKVEVQIGQSEYSDMFQSEGDEEEPTLEIKVQAIMETLTNGLKSKLDICYIQLYDNREMKFYSVHDKLTFYGRILKMSKNTNNFYDILCESFQKVQDGKQASMKNQKPQIVKKVKFRGQAKPFMKYLQKLQS